MGNGAGAFELAQQRFHGRNRSENDPIRKDREAEPEPAELFQGQVRRLAARCSVIEERNALEVACDALDVIAHGWRLHKQHVRARFAIAHAAFQRGFKPFHGDRIRARNDDEIRIVARIAGGLDLRQHVGGRDDALAGKVPAALGPVLVLDVDAGNAGLLEIAHGTPGVDRVAVAGVGVGDDGKSRGIGNAGCVVDHFGGREEADIRHTEAREARAESRHVHRFEFLTRHESCRERIGDAGCDGTDGTRDQLAHAGGQSHREVPPPSGEKTIIGLLRVPRLHL